MHNKLPGDPGFVYGCSQAQGRDSKTSSVLAVGTNPLPSV